MFVFGIFFLFYPYFRKKSYYNNLLKTLDNLDQKYLVSEMIEKSDFLEGQILENIIYEIDKSMKEKINQEKDFHESFKEYLELWVHEIKIPLATCFLLLHNESEKSSKKLLLEIEKIEDMVEKILYYARSENVEQDYWIKKTSLKKVVHEELKRCKNRLLDEKVTVDVSLKEETVRTDAKWLEFILHQIINNAIQYKRKRGSKLKIWAEEKENTCFLYIEDNGIGIAKEDLPRVFDKSFTGKNGRNLKTSTGMGLYLCKKLLLKMNHQIEITSEEGKFTRLTIIFDETSFYNTLHNSYKNVR